MAIIPSIWFYALKWICLIQCTFSIFIFSFDLAEEANTHYDHRRYRTLTIMTTGLLLFVLQWAAIYIENFSFTATYACNCYICAIISLVSRFDSIDHTAGESAWLALHFGLSFGCAIGYIVRLFTVQFIYPRCDDGDGKGDDSLSENSIELHVFRKFAPSQIANNLDHDIVMPSMVKVQALSE